ncbi:hypothetical protein NTE_01243 [Candidatus Nitrososphaera evergladensis SR1]|uniref:Uncharacterized protein n=1 Tax=Candidatus Nitrososphaera evergladensis SR1 TaxID=1459636 RepID=A0A075MQ56_9ARCH|nr:hypothetical protein [Candidatus Nitrososphaera evergladensis]AIF83313.1 hypothetical protein NTE_01243 [Candidatus Nitrososphaera evergladensis SR1]
MEKEFSLVLPTADDLSGEPAPTKDEVYAKIAKEIEAVSPVVADTLTKVFAALNSKSRWHVYLATKKWSALHGVRLMDSGYIGLTHEFVHEDIAKPCDIILYGTPELLQSGEIIVSAIPLEQGGLKVLHHKVLSVGVQGGTAFVNTEDENKKQFTVPHDFIFGKILRVIEFEDKEWHELIGKLINEATLVAYLEKALAKYSGSKTPNKARVDEINRRLAILKGRA